MATKKYFTKVKVQTIILLLFVIIVMSIVILAMATGRVALVWKESTQQVVINTRACNEEDVAKYNESSLYLQRGESQDYSIDQRGLDELVSAVRDKPSYQSDPTCQSILMQVAIQNKQYEPAKEAYDALNVLYREGKYVDTNLRTNGTLSEYEVFINELSPNYEANQDNNQERVGGGE